MVLISTHDSGGPGDGMVRKAVIFLARIQIRRYANDRCKVFFVRGCSFVLSYLGILFLLANRQLNITK